MAAIFAASKPGPKSLTQEEGARKGLLERHLLVEDHADQKCQGILDEVLVRWGSPANGRLFGVLEARGIEEV